MKVLLKQDVYNLGHAGDVKTVADGYGRNYLLPRGLAEIASATALKRVEGFKSAALKKRAAEQSDIDAVAQVINGSVFNLTARAGEKGKLFGSITSAQIADEISKKLGKEFDRRKVALREPIREVGTFTVPVRLSADINPSVTVVVSPEGGVVAQPAAPVVAEASAPAPAEEAAAS
ncbi:MAG TPA: 50S ribosomal protein L9 [Thermoflexales bacterium]|nr:50S ribosomal protein L9 [Thermoflexales bacterium]HQW34054.1 50S ribosomal protein L9 [Thermoflexales bacterium]HQZ22505.1 50S ribosomal protein L9 [Thermoflexales bacterium]HRA00084.1 50S ribosomal protein L9 [Thermoflexales bacterium]